MGQSKSSVYITNVMLVSFITSVNNGHISAIIVKVETTQAYIHIYIYIYIYIIYNANCHDVLMCFDKMSNESNITRNAPIDYLKRFYVFGRRTILSTDLNTKLR